MYSMIRNKWIDSLAIFILPPRTHREWALEEMKDR